MTLVSTKKMLLDAQSGGYAVGAFNAENMEMAQAIISAAQALNAPVIVQTTPSTVKYGDLRQFSALIQAIGSEAQTPVAIHLDHGDSYELAARAVLAGYTSVMIDGSAKPYEENVAITRKVVEIASLAGVSVEAELGKVGGKEDGLFVEDEAYTDPETAADFAKRTAVDSLAVAIGTAHGLYAKTPKLDVMRLKEIRRRVDIPLVLHGASGLSEDDVRRCIGEGICKVNFATELRIAYSNAVSQTFSQKPDVFDPKVYGKAARIQVQKLVENWITVLGCAGRA